MKNERMTFINKDGKELHESFPPDNIEKQLKDKQGEEFKKAKEMLEKIKSQDTKI